MSGKILVVDDEQDICRVLKMILSSGGFTVDTANEAGAAIDMITEDHYDLALVDIRLGKASGFDVLNEAARARPSMAVVMITAFGSIETAVRAVKMGAADYITKPFINDDVLLTVSRILEASRIRGEKESLEKKLFSRYDYSNFIGASPAIKETLALVDRVIPTKSNILITGESGVGKGLLARIIHYNSPRRDKPFVEINCGAIPESLMESELFGYKKGAFTGAETDKDGLMRKAHGGTLLLDEVGELPLGLQVKLLSAIQYKEITPVGGVKPVEVDARVIAASNRNLAEAVEAGLFRADLYYRLNVIEVSLPPLRERDGDTEPLAAHFLAKFNKEMGKQIKGFDPRVLSLFTAYPWPGNIRELENTVERAVAVANGELVTEYDLPPRIVGLDRIDAAPKDLKSKTAAYERWVIEETMARHKGDKAAAAEELNINLATLYRKLGKQGG